MDVDEFVAILGAVADVMGVIIWPAVLVFALVRFGPAIGNFLANLRELAVKGPGFEATATRSIEVAAALGVAILSTMRAPSPTSSRTS